MYIYIHIPFCTNICKYCDFPKLLYDKKYTNKYLDSLEKEITSRYKGEEVISIYIGGGTPTSLDYQELEKLLTITEKFKKNKTLEFTIESNIESLDINKISLLKKYGINRISLGVQSLNNNNLKELNRHHTKEMVFDIIDELKKNNINNISIDYIYGINESIEEVKNDIKTFLLLNIPHISCYSLIIEDNTVFGINKRDYINDEIELQMYNYIKDTLTKNNYIQYEISNYSKDNYYSIHNINYWNNGSYYGFGLGSVSYINNYRITNTKNLSKYLNNIYIDNEVYEDKYSRISNTLILGLRKTKGINIIEFNNKFNTNILDLYNIKELIKEKKLILENNQLFIAPNYFYTSNNILVNFV